MSTTPQKTSSSNRTPASRVRRGSIKVNAEAARALVNGHPWVYRHAIVNTAFSAAAGDIVDIVDAAGNFLGRGGYETEGVVAARIFTRDEKTAIDDEFFRNVCRRAVQLRQRFVEPDTDVYRLINGEADGIPGLTVTRFGQWMHAVVYAESIVRHAPAIYRALLEETQLDGIYEQQRLKPLGGDSGSRKGSRLAVGKEAPLEVPIREDGLTFFVDLTAPASVGFFPDYRLGRRRIRSLAAGKRMLNLFSHTGAFSVHALAGGAQSVVNVDIAARANARARQNAHANGFDDQPICITDDVFRALSRLQRKNERFDLVVLDPPTFASDKGRTWSAPKDMRELLADVSALCDSGALLLVTSNTVKLAQETFERAVAGGLARRNPVVLERPGMPADYPEILAFPESSYLKSVLVHID